MKRVAKRKYIWLPRPLWAALWRKGQVPDSRQQGVNVKVACFSDKHAKELRRVLRLYQSSLKRATDDVAHGVAEGVVSHLDAA